MKERPILFSGPMVLPILNTKPGVWPPEPIDPSKPFKSQTRRMVKLRDKSGTYSAFNQFGWPESMDAAGDWQPDPCPYGVPVDRLWVKEAWAYYGGNEYLYQREPSQVQYRATPPSEAVIYGESVGDRGRWRPSIHMPRWASRITLEVVSVRVERVESITEADAIAEGFDSRESFLHTFYDLNERAPRGTNPWVWRVEFKRVEAANVA